MAVIPAKVQPLIDGAFPEHVCLIGTVLPDGHAQITPRGSTQVYDGDHISLWERGRGSTTAQLTDGTKVTVFYFNLGARDVLPIGGIVRLYGTATVYKSGPVYDTVWERLIQPEKDWDKEKKGWAVLIKIDRAEDLLGQPVKE
jgi:Pyridoxamine 5'-phosphate oxidase